MNNHHENLIFNLVPIEPDVQDCSELINDPSEFISCWIEKLKKKDELKNHKQFVDKIQSIAQDDEELKKWIKDHVTKHNANQIGDDLIEGTYYVIIYCVMIIFAHQIVCKLRDSQ